MRAMLLSLLCIALVCSLAGSADATINHNGKFGLYLAGPEGSGSCEYVMVDCTGGVTHMYTPEFGSASFDLYLMAIDVQGIAGARYGLSCNITSGAFYFYGWESCSDLEIQDPSPWPTGGTPPNPNQLCGANNAQAWLTEQAGPHVTMGVLGMYVYAGTIARLCVGPDTRVGFAEFCDGTEPSPLCNQVVSGGWGCFGVNRLGYNPCSEVPVESRSWGAVKSLYR